MKDKRYSPPQYKKGDIVKASDGVSGKIVMISYEMGENWYFVNVKWYAERELVKS